MYLVQKGFIFLKRLQSHAWVRYRHATGEEFTRAVDVLAMGFLHGNRVEGHDVVGSTRDRDQIQCSHSAVECAGLPLRSRHQRLRVGALRQHFQAPR